MRSLIDGNDDEILTEEIHVSRPGFHARMSTLLIAKTKEENFKTYKTANSNALSAVFNQQGRIQAYMTTQKNVRVGRGDAETCKWSL